MILYQCNVSSTLIQSAQHGLFYVCADLGGGLYGTNRGMVKVAN